MAAETPAAVNRFQRLDKWWAPFLWVTVAPVVTWAFGVYLSILLTDVHDGRDIGLPEGGGYFGIIYFYLEVTPALTVLALPQILNLAPLLWAFSAKTEVRLAAILAGLVGLIHLVVPWLANSLDAHSRATNPDGVAYFVVPAGGLFWGMGSPLESWLFAKLLLALWLCFVLILAWWIFGRVRNKTKRAWRKVVESGAGVLMFLFAVAISVFAPI